MSSREIAELCEKQHKHVLRDIETMLDALEIDGSKFGHTYRDQQNREQREFQLDRDLTLTLVSGYKIKLRHRIIRRWQELEAGKPAFDPSTLSRMDILKMAMESERERQRLEHKVQEDAPKVAFHDQVSVLEGAMSVAQAAQTLGTGQQRLFQFLRKTGWVIGHQKNRPYQHIVQAGWMDLKLGRITKPNGTIQEIVTPLVTAKGLARLQKIYEEERAA
ncbi:MAG: phage regulatory protein/antirepressor Ant [Pseudomonadota bacterium]